VKGPWTVRFDPAQRGPGEPVIFDTLRDWASSADERIKYYSGTAVYRCSAVLGKISSGKRVFIDLGGLTAMAKVTVNGRSAGGVWTRPFRLDVTTLVRDGKNDVEIEVVNTWVNRLIGDSRLPAEQRPTWCPSNQYAPASPLQPSGLFGPVRFVTQ